MRTGFIAVVGRPNVGKSSLVNGLCESKVAIVSDKPQTTRRRIHGIVTREGYQLVLIDLPGFQRPLDTLTERMQRTVNDALGEIDGVLFVLSAVEGVGPGDRYIASRVFGREAPVVIALNKVDRLRPPAIAGRIVEASQLGEFLALHPLSALTGDGVDSLREELAALLPEGPAYFPSGEATDLPLALRVAEVVREKALALTREELPHAISVEVEEIEGATVRVALFVETESQKGIVVGKNGSMVRGIGSAARPEVEALLGRELYLDLRVKVRPKWRRDAKLLERLGM